MKIIFIYFIFLISIFTYTGCNQGIAPLSAEEEQQKAGFSGKVTFTGIWPDSAKLTLLVVFKDPLTSAASFNFFNVGYISHPIPPGVDTYTYSTEQDTGFFPISAGTYSYVAVVQSGKSVPSLNRADWKVVGLYYTGGDTTQPGKLVIPQNSLISNININCNFNSLPPQPPGGE